METSPELIEGEDVTNKDFISFIENNVNFIDTLLNDKNGDSAIHKRSERLLALRKTHYLSTFQNDAKMDERYILCSMDRTFVTLDPYIMHIQFKILTEKKHKDESDILDFGGIMFKSIQIRSLSSLYNTIRYVLMPELITAFTMDKKKMSYKEASRHLYGSILPTAHHVNMLRQVTTYCNFQIILSSIQSPAKTF